MQKNKIVKNATWIIACHIVQAILNLIVNMFVARYLGPSNYGLISYAASIVAFVVPVMQLGLNAIIVQEIVNQPNKEGEILGTSILANIIAATVSICFVFWFVLLVNKNEKETLVVCTLYSLNLIFQATQMIKYWFQAKLISKYTSITSLIVYVIVSGYRVILLITQKNIYWFAISQAIDYMLISLFLFIIYKKLKGQRLSFSFDRFKKMISVSRHYIVSAMMVTIFAQTDKIMLKLMINETATGLYAVAVTCAGMTSFVFLAIIDSARPVIVKSKMLNQEKFEKQISLLYSIIFYCSLFQSIVIAIFSETIINILYGSAYLEAASILRLVVWYTTFSYLGAARNVWILAENKERYLWIINLSGALANVLLNLYFIPIKGIYGAALASLITQFFTNIVVGFIIRPIRHNNYLLLNGCNPKFLVSYIKHDRIKKRLKL